MKIALLFFKIFPSLRSIHFCMRLNQLSKHFCHSDWGNFKACILKTSTASLSVEKRWPIILFFTYENKSKSFATRSGLYGGWLIKSIFWVQKKCSCLTRCVRARIVVEKSDPSSSVGFPKFLEDNWQTNDCVPLRIDCSALF